MCGVVVSLVVLCEGRMGPTLDVSTTTTIAHSRSLAPTAFAKTIARAEVSTSLILIVVITSVFSSTVKPTPITVLICVGVVSIMAPEARLSGVKVEPIAGVFLVGVTWTTWRVVATIIWWVIAKAASVVTEAALIGHVCWSGGML